MATRSALTLSIDVGSSHIKAAVVDRDGQAVPELNLKVDTPRRLTRARLLNALIDVAHALPDVDRISVGLPGIVQDGVVYSLPVLGSREIRGFALARTLEQRLRRPARVINDAEMHGLGAIQSRGVELVLTLGTGLGTALFFHGSLGARLEFIPTPGQPEPPGGPYGDAALERLGITVWSRQVGGLLTILRRLTNYDRCYVGGGNASELRLRFGPRRIRIDNTAAVVGGARLWERDAER